MMLVNHGNYQGKQVFSQSVTEQMMERNNDDAALDYDRQVGLGLSLNHCQFDRHVDVIEHGGQTMHYVSQIVAIPEYQLGAVVLANTTQAKRFVHEMARDLVADALNKFVPVKEVPVENKPQLAVTDSNTEIVKSSETMRGKYLTKSGLLTVDVNDSDMCACADNKRFDLIPMPDGWYGVMDEDGDNKSPKVLLSPQQVQGQHVLAARKGGRDERLGEYIPEKGIPPSWQKRLGDYQVENPDPGFPLKDVCLMEEDDTLYLSYRMPLLSDKRIDLPLTALDETQAITMGLGRGRGETVLAEQTEEGEYLLYSGYLVKKVSH
jgi:hypothetical protein